MGGPGNHCPPVPCQLFWIVLWSSHHTSHTRHKDTSAYYSSQNLGESIWFVYTVLTGTEQNNGEFPFSLGSHPSSNSGVILSMNSSRLVSSLDCSNFSFQIPDCIRFFPARLKSHQLSLVCDKKLLFLFYIREDIIQI